MQCFFFLRFFVTRAFVCVLQKNYEHRETKEERCGEYGLSLVNIFDFEALDCLGFIYVTKDLLPLSFVSLSCSKQMHNTARSP